MPSYIVKTSPDKDEYVYWSDVADDVHCVGTREEVTRLMRRMNEPVDADRFERADRTGTSSLSGFYNWDSPGFVCNQRWLPRDRLADYAWLKCESNAAAWDLLGPIDD